MEDKNILKKYEDFLKLNKLEASEESAKDFCEMIASIRPLELSMEYLKKGNLLKTPTARKKYYVEALRVCPDNFAAKIAILEMKSFDKEEYHRILSLEYDRLLKEEYLNPIYYKDDQVDFSKYQETFNYIRGLRSYYISLASSGFYDEAYQVGVELLELNPSDYFHMRVSLAVFNLRNGDTAEAISLLDSDSICLGAKELFLSYVAFLNLEEEKALSYLDDLEACHPYFYRLLTGETELTFNYLENDSYSDAEYLYINFSLIGDSLDDYQKLVDESLKRHPLLDELTSDERMIIDLYAIEGGDSIRLEDILSLAKKTKLHKELLDYSEGRLKGILEGLSARKILESDEITPYGNLFIEKTQRVLQKKSYELQEEGMQEIHNGNRDAGVLLLEQAVAYSPYNYYLLKDYYLYKEPFDFDGADQLLHHMSYFYEMYTEYDEKEGILMRTAMLEAMDELLYTYFHKAFQISLEYMVESIMRVPNPFHKYKNLADMGRILLGKKPESLFSTLYQEYLEKGALSRELFVTVITHSKKEVQDVYAKTGFLPYHWIDPKFQSIYEKMIFDITLDEITSPDEKKAIEMIYSGNGKKKPDEELLLKVNALRLEKGLWVDADSKNETGYSLAPWIIEYYKKKER